MSDDRHVPLAEAVAELADDPNYSAKRRLLPQLEAMGVAIRYDTRNFLWYVKNPPDYDPGVEIPLTDVVAEALRELIQEHFVVNEWRGRNLLVRPDRWPKQNFYDSLQAAANVQRFDPFLEWLGELPEWDGITRLDHCLPNCFEMVDFAWEPGMARDQLDQRDRLHLQYIEHASRSPFLAVIYRAQAIAAARPKSYKHDEMVILLGDGGGQGKSTFYRAALPDDDWFVDQVSFRQTYDMTKKLAENLRGKVFAEVGELAGISEANLADIKAALSGQSATFRPAYNKTAETHVFTHVLVGSTDQIENALPYNDNHRRFVPVEISGKRAGHSQNYRHVKDYWDRFRDQVWAEAKSQAEAGVPSHMPDDLADIHRELIARCMAPPGVRATTKTPAPQPAPTWQHFTTTSLYKGWCIPAVEWPEDAPAAIAHVKGLGWESGLKRIEGKVTRVWVAPTTSV